MDAKLLPYLTPAERGWQALAEAATPGPWVNKPIYPSYLTENGTCNYCHLRLVGERTDQQGRPYHLHDYSDSDDGWHYIYSENAGEAIADSFDYDDGGIASKQEDAAFITASRTAVPALLEALALARLDAVRYRNALEMIAKSRDRFEDGNWYLAASLVNIAAGAL